jgi:hypothetical protein
MLTSDRFRAARLIWVKPRPAPLCQTVFVAATFREDGATVGSDKPLLCLRRVGWNQLETIVFFVPL